MAYFLPPIEAITSIVWIAPSCDINSWILTINIQTEIDQYWCWSWSCSVVAPSMNNIFNALTSRQLVSKLAMQICCWIIESSSVTTLIIDYIRAKRAQDVCMTIDLSSCKIAYHSLNTCLLDIRLTTVTAISGDSRNNLYILIIVLFIYERDSITIENSIYPKEMHVRYSRITSDLLYTYKLLSVFFYRHSNWLSVFNSYAVDTATAYVRIHIYLV